MTKPSTLIRRRDVLAALGCSALTATPRIEAASRSPSCVPVLVYHRFSGTAVDSMTVREATFRAHLRVLADLDCRVVQLADVVAWRSTGALLPPRSVALTADDAHRSQAEVMAPMLKETAWPMTLFVYPSAVSNAAYAMTWAQLANLQASGRFRIESHTYWHPHLLRERRSRSTADFERFATHQLVASRAQIEHRLGARPAFLAWPFGMTDDGLMALASRLGYEASFTLGNRPVSMRDELQALPRYLMTDAVDAGRLARLLTRDFSVEAPR